MSEMTSKRAKSLLISVIKKAYREGYEDAESQAEDDADANFQSSSELMDVIQNAIYCLEDDNPNGALDHLRRIVPPETVYVPGGDLRNYWLNKRK